MTMALTRRKVGGPLVVVALLPVAWFLVSPLFVRSTLVETLVPASAVVGVGSFNEIDLVHKGRGTATVSRLPDGRLQVLLSDFSVTNGPDLYVYLSKHASPSGHAQVTDGVQLGKLKATEGAFGYETETPVDPEKINSVVIYCYAFRTIFSIATLA
jgi:hypothetical protein